MQSCMTLPVVAGVNLDDKEGNRFTLTLGIPVRHHVITERPPIKMMHKSRSVFLSHFFAPLVQTASFFPIDPYEREWGREPTKQRPNQASLCIIKDANALANKLLFLMALEELSAFSFTTPSPSERHKPSASYSILPYCGDLPTYLYSRMSMYNASVPPPRHP